MSRPKGAKNGSLIYKTLKILQGKLNNQLLTHKRTIARIEKDLKEVNLLILKHKG